MQLFTLSPVQCLYKLTIMRYIILNCIALFFTVLTSIPVIAQDTVVNRNIPELSREFYEEQLRREKIIPDKIFEVGMVFLLVFIVTNAIITVFKVNADRRIKEKALDKGISEATLIELFRQDKNVAKNNYLKWFLILAALGVSLIYIHILDQYKLMSSAAISLGLISLCMSIAFFIYYRIIRNQK